MRHCEGCEVTEVIGAALATPICATSAGCAAKYGIDLPAFGGLIARPGCERQNNIDATLEAALFCSCVSGISRVSLHEVAISTFSGVRSLR